VRISVWQQFSSNHSSRLTIMGVFESSEKAQEASEKLRDTFSHIDAWYKSHPEAGEAIFESGGEDVSEIEQQLGAQYNINWNRAMLWAWNYRLKILDQVIVISQEFGADSGVHPIDQLLERLGGKVGVDGDVIWYERVARTMIEIDCDAPNEAVAQNILKTQSGDYAQIADSLRVKLHIEPFRLNYSPLVMSEPELFDLMNLLKSHGCQNIDVQFTEERKDGEYFEDEG